jgi:hypothetical protein|tara:strand:+ start:3554 stop:3832 length:279 start_codon:yes stop_codon:yes gene_type:complete
VGYEGGNVPKEMADCAMADILSTIIRRAAFVFVVSKEKKNELFLSLFFLCFVFFGELLDERIFYTRERVKERKSQRETLRTFENTHNNIIIR